MSQAHSFILDHEQARLGACSPFNAVAPDRLRVLLEKAQLVFFAAGSPIFNPQVQSTHQGAMIVRSGSVSMRGPFAEESAALTFGPGMLLPLDFAARGRQPAETYTAVQDCFCWSLDSAGMEMLFHEPALLRWSIEQSWRHHDRMSRIIAADNEASRIAAQIKFQTLGSVVKRPAVTVDIAGSINDAISLMTQHRVGSVVVTGNERVAGILTESDILRRALSPAFNGSRSVTDVMTPSPVCLPETAPVAEAALEMTSRSIRHLPVVAEDGTVIGMISERDLFALQRTGFGHLEAPLDRADTVEALRDAVAGIRATCSALFRHGMGAEQVTALVSSLNDRVLARLMRIIGEPDLGSGRYCWLAFGSEGRQEQTFSTDQDNGIVFTAPPGDDTEALRTRLLSFADMVNQALDVCGFPLCEGDIMARNPRWCLTLDEWKSRFSSWVRTPDPEALLRSNIFFDLRPLHGDLALAQVLFDHLFQLCREHPLFLHLMAKNALDTTPPLGVLSRFSTDGGKDGGTVDLKKRGARLFVDIGRILALAHGIRATNTAQRLRLGGSRIRRRPASIEADVAAFHYIQGLRMRGQLSRTGDSHRDPNRIDPYSLNEIEQRVLIESLKQVSLLQARLRMDYQV